MLRLNLQFLNHCGHSGVFFFFSFFLIGKLPFVLDSIVVLVFNLHIATHVMANRSASYPFGGVCMHVGRADLKKEVSCMECV